MNFYHFSPDNRNKYIAIGLGVVVILFLMISSGSTSSVFSTWRGDGGAAAPATLSGNAAQISQIGQGDTLVAPPNIAADEPWGNPVIAARVVMTQGYDTGSHAPAQTWGAIDLAVDGNGDGVADPDGSWGAPVRATMSGIVQLAPDSWPAGNHVWVIGDRYKTGYAHLLAFAVQDGQYVERGTIIGTMGSSGSSSGPHLHYHIWLDGINQNPLDHHPLP